MSSTITENKIRATVIANLQIKMSELGLGLQMFLSKGQTDFNLWDAYSGLNPSDKKAPTSQDSRSQSALPGFTVQQGPIDDNLNYRNKKLSEFDKNS
jgi:hypothetical protein